MNRPLILGFVFLLFLDCKNTTVKDNDAFIVLKQSSYTTSSINGITVYRLNERGRLMNGYYVIYNELSKWEEFRIENGILNGDYITFHPNGNLSSSSSYSQGQLHGEDRYYFPSGKLQRILNFTNGKRTGEIIRYFESGQIRGKSKLKNEEVIESVTFDIIGNIESQSFIKDSRTITQIITNGKVHKETISSNYDDYEAIKLYNEDGSIKHFFRMLNQDEAPIIVELDAEGNELKRINLKDNPQEGMKYMQLLGF